MAEESLSNEQQTELLFMQLVMMFQGMAMQQLGKVMNPMTQKVERDLGQAKNFIDLLSMLEAKTKGNLTDNEEKLLQQSLFDLRMNYVDEMKKADSPEESSESAENAEPKAPVDTEETTASETTEGEDSAS